MAPMLYAKFRLAFLCIFYGTATVAMFMLACWLILKLYHYLFPV